MVKFGILGCGGIAGRFASVLNSDEVNGAELVATASKDLKKAQDFGAKHGAKRFYGNYDELANDSEIDIVYVATTHNFHYENAKLLVEHGKNVICEKPFFLTKAEAEEVAALARSKGVLITEAMWTRYLPAFQKAREWAQTGAIGKTRFIDASFCFNVPFNPANRLYDPNLAGGALYDAGVYPLEFITGIAGQHPQKVSALFTKASTGVDETATINLQFANGILGQARTAVACATNNDAYIYGTSGYIIVYNFIGTKVAERYNADNTLAERFESEFKDGFNFEINNAVEMVKTGKTNSNQIPIEDTIANAAIYDEIFGIKK